MSLRHAFAIIALAGVTASVVHAVEDPGFQLPPGFTIKLVAGPPLVNHPTMGGFDDKGRLYICDGPGENLPAKELLEKLPNHIRRLEDTDGDGKFDKSTMFADKMTFPMGALWHDGYVYTASPPHIWRLRDTDDDGIADERKILVSEFGFTGNAADIHGCFLGPEGRIYWCDGRHGHNFTDEHGNSLSKGLAARIFSCKPDGSDVRAFAGGGMDNPVEICFTEEGEMLGTVAIFDNKPDRVDAIVHWVYGGAYPYHEKVLGEFKRTGDLLPAVSRFGRVAPAGILRYRGKHLGDEYTNDLFHAQFNTHRVVRTKLTRKGASFTSVDEDFLVSENQDVHLTDVIEDADGSLLVVDTGGWFRIGCPNSQIAKPDILGGIYRIRRTGAPRDQRPYSKTLEVVGRPRYGDDAVALEGAKEPLAIANIAANIADKRSAAAVPALLAGLAKSGGDRFVDHAIIYALQQIGAAKHTAVGLKSDDTNVRRGALIALDQMDGEHLERDQVASLLDTTDAALQSTVLGVMQKHPDWAPAVVDWLKTRLANPSLSADQLRLVQNTLLAYKADPAIQQLLVDALSGSSTSTSVRVGLLEVVEQAELTGKQTPAVWNTAVAAQLASADEAVVRQAIAAARVLDAEAFREPLLAIVREVRGGQSLMIAALKALGPAAGEPDGQTFKVLTDSLTVSSDPLDRLAAADCLSKLPLSSNQRATIVDAVATAGPLELPALLGAFEKSGSAEEGNRLAAALAKSPGVANLTVGQVEKLFERYPSEVRSAAEPILQKLNADLASQRARLAELEAQLAGGDVNRGKNLFTIKKTSCIACHTVKGQGGRIGPDLSNVGQIRSRTDILESILFPSASFVRGFESVTVTTSAGLEVTGILSRETPEAVYIKTAQREEIRVPRQEVDEIAPSKLSIMPTGLDKTLTIAELRDLVAYLQSLK
jgi:putative membrane-bound dehydrogenase-like protein